MSTNAEFLLRTVLVAEDEPDILELMTYLLEEMSFRVTAVENGQQAVDAVLAGHFQLAILDVTMPVMDGLTAARLIKLKRPEVLIGLHTAMDELWVRKRFAEYDGYWLKPVDSEAFGRDLARLMPVPGR